MGIDPVSLAITVALNAATMAMSMSRTIEGPRLSDLTATVADYGTPINYFYGKRRLECPCFFAEPIKEKKKKRKTKGGKYKEYTYFGTWAIIVADHAIETVSRMWFDRNLVYDRTGAGPSSVFELKDGYDLEQAMRIYTGTETQEPDARLTTYIESQEGADTTPAYRGVTYIVFEDIPLEKMGNRLPQVSVEAITAGSPIYPWETFPTVAGQPTTMAGFTFSSDFSRFMWSEGGIEIWDTASLAPIRQAYPNNFGAGGATFGISRDGTVYRLGDTNLGPASTGIYTNNIDFTVDHGELFPAPYISGVRLLTDGNGNEHVITMAIGYSFWIYSLTVIPAAREIYTPTELGVNLAVGFACVDAYGDVWVCGNRGDYDDDLYLYKVVDTGARPNVPDLFTIHHGHFGLSAGLQMAHYDGHFIVHWGGSRLLKIDDETGDIVDDVAQAGGNDGLYQQWANLRPGASSIWINGREVSLSTLATIQSPNLLLWKNENVAASIYDPINHALICAPQFSQVITVRFLDRISSDGVTLQSIVEDVSDRVAISGNDIDASDLTQTVKGYSWTQGQAKQIIAPLLELYDADARPHDFQVQFMNRG